MLTPLSQTYELAPLPVNVVCSPEHKLLSVAFAFTVGKGFSVTVTEVLPVQPPASVIVTDTGLSEISTTTVGVLSPVDH